MEDIFLKQRKILKEVYNFPPDEGFVLSLKDDKVFRIFMRRNIKFLAKIISIVIDIPYDDLLNRMVLADNNTPEDKIFTHYNSQDIVVSIDNKKINIEMGSNRYKNKRKNEITANKYAGNLYIEGEKYENTLYYFYQICIEDYNIFKNNLLISKSTMVEISSGNYEIESDEFIKYHINLKNIDKSCYNENNKYFKFFTLTKISDLEDLSKGDEILMEALDDLKNLSTDSMLISELEEQKLNDYCNKTALIDAKKDGLTEGKQIGLTEGKQIRNIEIVKKSLEQGIDIETISTITGLTIEEINNLKEETTL